MTCDICDTNPQKCQAVTKLFARKKLTEGYHFMYTIPESACHVLILEKHSSENFLALRWTVSKEYFLNGDWVIEGSGNYSAKGNSFTYFSPGSMKNSTYSGQWIKFDTQLTHAVDVDLIYQSENRGVEFSYFLPPFAKSMPGQLKKNSMEGNA